MWEPASVSIWHLVFGVTLALCALAFLQPQPVSHTAASACLISELYLFATSLLESIRDHGTHLVANRGRPDL
jgi:predicted membrane channel-forming protein YqfA (hemolysin III family)